jgi:hypothetical protein
MNSKARVACTQISDIEPSDNPTTTCRLGAEVMDTRYKIELVTMVISTCIEWCWLWQRSKRWNSKWMIKVKPVKYPIKETKDCVIAWERDCHFRVLKGIGEALSSWEICSGGVVARPLYEAIAKPPSSRYQESWIFGSKGRWPRLCVTL